MPILLHAEESDVAAGHSFHGEAFNEGPRQGAVLIPGMPKIEFPTSSKSKPANEFFVQGVAQLHGFWYLEAERSFRQAAKLDPNMAIAYWGMAMANANNGQRARGLIDKAMDLRKDASSREKRYIEALERFLPKKEKDSDEEEQTKAQEKEAADKAKEEKKKRGERYIADLEKLIHEHPDDLEARAFLVVHMWQADRYGVKLTSRYAVNALIGEILEQNPAHPVHHYRIHLWDSQRPDNALRSAALCGPAGPGIAHMWHMPGHIYSKLKRYGDAAWQQEASARVDHAHMNRARLMPDQIHNFAHNNEWLTRNLIFVGRVDEALDQARNLVSLPRHPKYNSLEKRGSHKYGRMRLLQTLSQFELWQELIDETEGQRLPPTDNDQERWNRTSWRSVAFYMLGNRKRGSQEYRLLQRERLSVEEELLDLADQQAEGGNSSEPNEDPDGETEESPSRDDLKKQLSSLRSMIARAGAAAAVARKDVKAFNRRTEAAKLDKTLQAQWQARVGDLQGAIKLAEETLKKSAGQVRPLAVLVDLHWQKGNKPAAKKHFEKLRELAGDADLEAPMFDRLAPVAKALKFPKDWRKPKSPAKDLGERPPLDDLGPFRWQPYTSPSWEAKTAGDDAKTSEDFAGQPRILIFYLGFGCLHCVEQLHAFSPHVEAFEKAGIQVIGISTESCKDLAAGIKNFDKKLSIPLLSDSKSQAFKSFRCWDDFEDQPLHGTFLIDEKDRVRWQDISYEPFTDAEFLLKESKRLLQIPIQQTR